MKDTDKFYLECECGSHAVVFEQFIDDGAVNISYKVDVFTYKQEGIFRKLFRRVELSLNILFGGEALLYDIYIGEQKLLDELKMFIQGMENIKENVN